MKFSLFSMFLIFASFAAGYSAENKSVAIAGFINMGVKSDDSTGKVIGHSLNIFLAKIPGLYVTAYEASEKIAEDNKFWGSDMVQPEKAVDIGLLLSVQEIIAGEYVIDQNKETIKINVYVFDTVTGELKLKRQYMGESDASIFDTIDKMIYNISTFIAGRVIRIGKLEVESTADKEYSLSINGRFMKKISKQEKYNETELAETPLNIILSEPATGNPLYSTNITIADGETVNLTYVELSSLQASVPAVITNISIPEITMKLIIPAEKPAGKRVIYGSIHAFLGGIGGSAALDFQALDYLRLSVLGGSVWMKNAIIPTAAMDASFMILKLTWFSVYVKAGSFCYYRSFDIFSGYSA